MPWEPDSDLRDLLDLTMTEIREPRIVRLQRDDWNRIEREMAARGVLLSGGSVAALRDAARQVVEEIADEFVGTILPRIVEFSGGRLPEGAGDWIRSYFDMQVNRTAIGLCRTIMERHTVKTIGHRDAFERSIQERLTGAVAIGRRRLEIQLKSLELSRRLRAAPPQLAGTDGGAAAFDVFVSYATEDGADIARPLAAELERRGFRVWIDQGELRIGASLMDTIEQGLARSRFGVVVISPAFLSRKWPRRELNALATIADAEDRKVILPIWHGVDRATLLAARAVFLADLFALNAAEGIPRLADAIERELREPI